MVNVKMGLLDILVEDIILKILSLTDVPTILSTSQVSLKLMLIAVESQYS